ncbi:FAD-dependent oxidoreductase [Enterococcus sp. AZ109]|uniref:oxidoreductase n=1 Tax=Enterococcus sp. AZ109 TaxID=2774634 RepID=UPI003F25FDEB
MKPKYKPLFEPFKIGKVEIKNKFCMAPMGTLAQTDETNSYTPDAVEYFEERARGGVGLIITGANWVESDIEKHNDAFFPSPTTNESVYEKMGKEITDKVHPYGTKIFMQLTAGLGRSALPTALKNTDYIAPSKTINRWIDEECRALTTEEVETIVKKFAESAHIAQKVGFDGVEIHAMHEGYLLDCFTMTLFNQRTDKYGGDLRGRLTFPIEIVQAIKARCGQDFPVILRFSIKSYIKALRQGAVPGEEFTELGRDVEESLEAAKILQEAGYDAFDADAGTYDAWYWAHPPMYFEKGMYLPLAQELKKVTKVPVIVAGRMENPEMAVEALQSGKIDAVGIGRQLLTDPDYVNKVMLDDLADIRPCLGCHDGCFGRLLEGGRGSCAVNPQCGREPFTRIVPAQKSKTIVIVGGGPAGLEAARVSALRGHKVTLFEAKESVGGSLNIGGIPSFKHDDLDLVEWYKHQMEKLSVEVRLNEPATREKINELKPDAVFVAEGSHPIKLQLPGEEKNRVHLADEILKNEASVKEKCVIIGGGLVGCELALHLALQRKQVTIVEALPDILKSGSALAPMNEWMLRDLLAFHNVEIIANAKAEEVTEKGLIVNANDGKREVAADTIILAVGYKSKSDLFEELRYDSPYIYHLGDGVNVRNIRAAIWDGFEVARNI